MYPVVQDDEEANRMPESLREVIYNATVNACTVAHAVTSDQSKMTATRGVGMYVGEPGKYMTWRDARWSSDLQAKGPTRVYVISYQALLGMIDNLPVADTDYRASNVLPLHSTLKNSSMVLVHTVCPRLPLLLTFVLPFQ